MPKTRERTEEKRQKDRERQRHHRAHLSPEKKAAVRQRQRESRKIRKMQKEEKLAALQEKARQFTVKAKFLAAKNAEMKENVKEYEALLAEEPMVNDDDAGNVRDSFAYARSKPALFEVLTGETNESFDELFELLKAPLAARNYRGEVRQRAASGKPRIRDKHQLYICLLFLRQYPTYAMLMLALRALDELTLHHYIHRVLCALDSLTALQIKWPSDAEFDELLKKQQKWPFAWLRNVVCAVDGTEIRVARPTTGAIKNKHYSGKKKQYALNVLLVVRLDGVIIYCSEPQPKMHDQSFWKETGLRSRFLGKPYGIIGDGGFTFNYAPKAGSPANIISHSPHKRPRRTKANPERQKLSDVQKRENAELSKTRVVVENTNRRLKQYKILGTKLRHYHHGPEGTVRKGITPALVVRVVAGLTNRAILRSPIRSMDWVPEKVVDSDLISAEGSDEEEVLEDEVEKDE